jgi:hypothetical protein
MVALMHEAAKDTGLALLHQLLLVPCTLIPNKTCWGKEREDIVCAMQPLNPKMRTALSAPQGEVMR